MNLDFLISSILLGIGLAMDAFSVSLANGLHEAGMGRGRMCKMAGVYAFFQYIMPLTGWFFVHTIVQLFSALERFIPWIGFFLLLYLGMKMILEGIHERGEGSEGREALQISGGELFLQGIATSIDALSVGFTIAGYAFGMANAAALIIAAVTFVICIIGLLVGRSAGTKLSWKASVLGGTILVLIGIKLLMP